MALPSSYLTSFKNLPAILDSIKAAQAPERFTIKFLQDIGYTSAADRLIIKMLKVLGMLRESGEPTQAYHEFLDPSQSGRVLADGLRSAYSDLFQINKNAQNMGLADVRAKFKTISQGAFSDDVLGKMANTFISFAKHADFDAAPSESDGVDSALEDQDEGQTPAGARMPPADRVDRTPKTGTRLVYDINIHLPATRDPAVYDALFASMSKHLNL